MARRSESESASAPKTPDHRRGVGFTIGYIATFLLGLWLLQLLVANPLGVPAREIPYSEFRAKLKGGELVDVTIGSPRITGHMKNPAATSERDKTFRSARWRRQSDPKLLDELDAAGVKYRVKPPPARFESVLLLRGCCRCCCSAAFGTRCTGAPAPGRGILRRRQEQGDRSDGRRRWA